MNQLNKLITILLMLVLTSCAGSQVSESTGEFFDDSVITTRVKGAILSDARLRSADISVTTFKGAVQLSGFVDSKAVANIAVQRARTISGVKVVNNSLIIKK